MAFVRDLSGNTPKADSDQALAGQYDLQAVVFKGTQHTITLSGTSQQTTKFSRACRAIRIAPRGDCHWEVGLNPVATTSSPHLTTDGVEIIPIAFNDMIALIQGDVNTELVTITEDRS
ncbi:hypothetical protein LCGC14_1528810 [marine sediment metagenome]|uniref:Uncharacterized protein n=1 Tax=marine sediment metagenome TaxID=412755 RepID=A0A0F9LXC8_9ZZZZ